MTTLDRASRDADSWTAKGTATRARIVAAAAELIHEHGVAGTSLEDIRAGAGVSNSQLYHYFADKSHLVCAVITHQSQRIVAVHEGLLSKVDSFPGLQAWRDIIVEFVSLHQGRQGCPMGSLAGELAEMDEAARALLVEGFARWEGVIRDGLAAMRRHGQLRPDADPERLALATLAALQGGLLLAQTRRDPRPVETALDAALAHIHTFAAQ